MEGLNKNFRHHLELYLQNQESEHGLQSMIHRASSNELKEFRAILNEKGEVISQEQEKVSFVGKHLLSRRYKELSAQFERLEYIHNSLLQAADEVSVSLIKIIGKIEAGSKSDLNVLLKLSSFNTFLEKHLKKGGVVTPDQKDAFIEKNKTGLHKAYFKLVKARSNPLHENPLTKNEISEFEHLASELDKTHRKTSVAPEPIESPKHVEEPKPQTESLAKEISEAYRLLKDPRHTLPDAAVHIRENIFENLTPHRKLMFLYDLILMLVNRPLDDIKLQGKQNIVDSLVAMHITRQQSSAPFNSDVPSTRKYYKKINEILKTIRIMPD